jgi:penicillin-binding protein 1A
MKDAVLAAEDARFYEHGGVDYKGVARAALENLRDARSQGASTITMQVARNFYLSTEKTFTRKIYEILLALKIERLLSKDQILELYMNQIFLGQRASGFAAAAQIYFGKKLADVSVAEAAMLAGLPKAPSAYNPIANPKRATLRQRYIIERMFENGFIDEAQRTEALAQQLRYSTPSVPTVHGDFVAEAARQLVFAQYGEESYTRGLNVYVSVDSEQAVAHRALRNGLLASRSASSTAGPRPMSTCHATRRSSMRAWPRRWLSTPTTTSCAPPWSWKRRRGRWWRCCRTATASPSPAPGCARWLRAWRPRRLPRCRSAAAPSCARCGTTRAPGR